MLPTAKSAPLLAASLLVAALIAACGSSSASSSTSNAGASSSASSSTQPAAAPAAHALTLSETEFKITPSDPTVPAAGPVTITVRNDGKVTHALSVQTPSGVVSTGRIAPGASATLKVDLSKPGRYVFFCPIDGHRMLGMQGTLVSGGSSGVSGGAGSTTPASSSAGPSNSY
ncbi:MAG: cupredoxin domain-containing protein [Solirubrobacterales bacterium]|nr:cupredoxin domain-containing protein [Solirubrobacterales bacterium]MBV9471924.1 cupredoxin domain-containing protein [Solirubrobacterales bacterium]MBV9837159.1 cupredoxin domain-containing protein [Solirubrobacterales bacterium]